MVGSLWLFIWIWAHLRELTSTKARPSSIHSFRTYEQELQVPWTTTTIRKKDTTSERTHTNLAPLLKLDSFTTPTTSYALSSTKSNSPLFSDLFGLSWTSQYSWPSVLKMQSLKRASFSSTPVRSTEAASKYLSNKLSTRSERKVQSGKLRERLKMIINQDLRMESL